MSGQFSSMDSKISEPRTMFAAASSKRSKNSRSRGANNCVRRTIGRTLYKGPARSGERPVNEAQNTPFTSPQTLERAGICACRRSISSGATP